MNELTTLKIHTPIGVYILYPHLISRCEANEKQTIIHLTNGTTFEMTTNFTKLENVLTPHSFYRIHRSHLINLNCLMVYNKRKGHVKLLNGVQLPVSRIRGDSLLELLNLTDSNEKEAIPQRAEKDTLGI